jgi:hypothetical protein
VASGGGPSLDGKRWINCRKGFFLPVQVLSRLFRRLFLAEMHKAFNAGSLVFCGDLAKLAHPVIFARQLDALRRLDWVVYAKPPFGGPEQVLAYLGRYTHRVAIANSRLLALDEGSVRFAWKDYRHGGHTKVMALEAGEFIRRFLLHTLPDGFHRIRHYGFLANGARTERLARCRQLLDVPATSVGAKSPDEHDRDRKLTWRDFALCPDCGGAALIPASRWRQPSTAPRSSRSKASRTGMRSIRCRLLSSRTTASSAAFARLARS